MDHGPGRRRSARAFAEAEKGGAALEMALLLGLAAVFAFTVKHGVVSPLLATFARAARAVSEALAG